MQNNIPLQEYNSDSSNNFGGKLEMIQVQAKFLYYDKIVSHLSRDKIIPNLLVSVGNRTEPEDNKPKDLIMTAESSKALSISANDNSLKTTEEVTLQILLLCQFGVGTVANVFLLLHNVSPVFTGSQQRPAQVILSHMAVANALILFLTIFPNKIMTFAQRYHPTDLKCKLEFFTRLVVRSSNLCSTCVLSIHQFVTVVPVNRGKFILRGSVPNLASYSCYSCWFFSILNNIYIPIKVTGPQITDNNSDYKNKLFCSTSGFSIGIVFLRFVHDATFMSIMVWTSVSMVLLLHRHRQRMQHILTAHQDHRGQAETRATHTILMVVVTFIDFYLLNFICIIFQNFLIDSRLFMRHVGELLDAGFPTISPLLLIFRDPKDPCSVLLSC
ncbi:vomeronasal type-1 receptor 4-like [Arvicanthis niloticus]|uniref:vomeronasal type-1 receptor 4-like n=1 Tax=Arvicanthis niloticus TaxID=61156 RepID=UPI00148686FC|nr:vomeronasal type-1 receptor 4-like [Arvicanthis niloticus]